MANPLNRYEFASAYDPRIVADYIAKAASARGIDPAIALRVARSEGLGSYVGDQGSSFGPFQLHYGNVAAGGNRVGGLGDTFTKQTGFDARDPSTWQAQVDFSLDQAARGGWGPWHGWKGDPWAGIKGDHKGEAMSAPSQQPQAYQPPPGYARPLAYTSDPMAPSFPSLKAPAQQPQRQPQMEDFFAGTHIPTPAPEAPPTQAPAPQAAPAYLMEDSFEGKRMPKVAAPAASQPSAPPTQGEIAPMPQGEWGFGREMARGAVSGLTGGMGDLTRAGATVEALAGGPSGFFERRRDIIARQEAARQAYEAENPGLSAVATGLGAGVGTVLPMAGIARGVGMAGQAVSRALPRVAPMVERAGAFAAGEGGIPSAVAHGTLYGAGETALSQGVVPEEDRGLKSIMYGAGTGGVLGGVGKAVLGPMTKSFTAEIPEARKNLARLANDKYDLGVHVAQVAQDKKVNDLYHTLTSNEHQTAQIQKWNKHLSEKIGLRGEPLTGENIEKGMRHWGDTIANSVRGKTVTVDNTFQNELYRIHADVLARTPPGDPARQAVATMYNDIMGAIGPRNTMTGEVLNNFIRYQRRIDRTFGANKADPLLRTIGHNLREAFIDAFARSNPSVAGQFTKARQNYKSLAAVDEIVGGRDIGAIDPSSLLSKVRSRKITGDVKELARIGQYLPKMGGTGASKTGGQAGFTKLHAGEVAASLLQPISMAFNLGIPYGQLVSGAAAADLARRGIQQGMLRSKLLNRAALSDTFPAAQAATSAGNVLLGTGAGLGGGVGGMEKR